jgi:cellobiose phosphorylase
MDTSTRTSNRSKDWAAEMEQITRPDTYQPAVALLGNGRYAVMISAAGAGTSTWRDLDVTRWREDGTRDNWGQFCYLRDRSDGKVWSAGYQPLGGVVQDYEVVFQPWQAAFRRRDGDIETRMAVCVSPDHDAEVRLVTIVNRSSRARVIDITSYSEVCLNQRRADQAHPAFAKLFLEAEFVEDAGALLCRRRPRAADQKPIWAVHAMAADGPLEYETDRARFLGRGHNPANPIALAANQALSGTTGPVLDPVFSLRRILRLAPTQEARAVLVTGAADSREQAIALAEEFQTIQAAERVFDRAREYGDTELRELGLAPGETVLFNRLAGAVLFADPALRSAKAMAANRLGQPGLWPYAISGDRPIVLVRLGAKDDTALGHQLVRWHGYARRRGMDLDLVILDERGGEELERLKAELESGAAGPLLGKPGGLFLLAADKVPEEGRILIEAATRAVLRGDRGPLAEQLRQEPMPAAMSAAFEPQTAAARLAASARTEREELLFWNGLGGFTADGREYVIVVDGSGPDGPQLPPAPWINVLANPGLGCLATEAGSGYTWAGNSQANRLTPWSNDPVSDPPGEAIYMRDEATGEFWSPTPLPCGAGTAVTVRHGQGYTRYVCTSHGLEQELLVLVARDDPVKLACLKVRNIGDRSRRLTATYYAEWVLGTIRDNAPMQVVCEREPAAGAVLAQTAWGGSFAGHVAFLGVGARPHSFTADRMEFLGRQGSPQAPAALRRKNLAGRIEPLLDPCAAIMAEMTITPGQSEEITFVIGQTGGRDEVKRLVAKYTAPGRAREELAAVQAMWDGTLNAVQVQTPDPAIDVLLNRWLVYQVMACRLWARSAFYQSGGAYGFRDQLQDVMALVYGAPQETRAQILRSAARQFEEGDVQHWWHPPSGAGVRTRITDDLFFLPLVTHHYVMVTGDDGILDEQVPFLKAPVLRPDQEEEYNVPETSAEKASLYEHCVRVLEHGYRLGPHDLPLMGTGDWNDGMNKVGAHGRGESVWNGWFILTVLKAFAELADKRGDRGRAAWCRERVESLRGALEAHAWDGHWYRRAYFDDGTPLGSAGNDECQIDALPQAWSVISRAGAPERVEKAMAAVDERLVDEAAKLIRLFTPPFDRGKLEPGYIKGYVPGIRENGGQYTHGVSWVVLATAMQGRGDRAVELWNLLNPINHGRTPAEVAQYKVEPYVVCADVYGATPHTGRGGWTWYTGAAGWLYRTALEAILGLRVRGSLLQIEPCIPISWPGYQLTYRFGSATYQVRVDNSAGAGRGVRSITADGQQVKEDSVRLSDDGQVHEIQVILGGRRNDVGA